MQDKELKEASNIISNDGVIITPTDTLYGLAANIFSSEGVNRIFDIKDRDRKMALPILVSNWEQCLPLVTGDLELGFQLQQKFWPGALTMIFKKTSRVPDYLTAGKDTVAVRMPNHSAPLFLCQNSESPITGTSANLSGDPDALRLSDIPESILSNVDKVLNTRPVPQGVPSTIIDLSGTTPIILRQGAIYLDEVLKEV